MNKELVAMLLQLPDHMLDACMKPRIEKWSTPPTALQILEVLDHCIHGALASGMIIALLQLNYKDTCDREGTTHETLVPLATWRQGI